jgi:hypothetical protein
MYTVFVGGEDEPNTYICTHPVSMSTLTLQIMYVALNDMRFIAINYKVYWSSLGLSLMYGIYIFGGEIIGNSTKGFANT